MQFPVSPTPTPITLSGEQVTDVIDAIDRTANTFQDFTFGIAVLFVVGLAVLALIAYFYFNRNASKGAQTMLATFAEAMGRTNKEKDERIDKLEAEQATRDEKYIESLSAIGDGLNRIADVVTLFQKREVEHDRVLSDAVSVMTGIATVGSKPLQQVVKNVGELQHTNDEIHRIVSQIYDRFLKVFPAEKPAVEEIRDVLIVAVNQACEEKKHKTGELPLIVQPATGSTVTVTPPDAGSELPKAS